MRLRTSASILAVHWKIDGLGRSFYLRALGVLDDCSLDQAVFEFER